MSINNCKNRYSETNINEPSGKRARIADLYLVELSGGLSVIATAGSSRKLTRGTDLSEILDFSVSDALRKYLLSYGEKPIVIPTFIGSALIFPQVFSSSRIFGVVFFKKEKRGTLLRIASAKGFEGRVGFLEETEEGRIRKWDEPLAEDLNNVLNIADAIMKNAEMTVFDGAPVLVEKLDSLIGILSEIVGISVELHIDEGIVADDGFDRKLFTAFALMMLSLAKSYHALAVRVRVYQKDFGLTAAFSFESTKPLSRVTSREIAHFNAISDANNMIFECDFKDGVSEITFTPSRKDWSLLELKFPNDIIL